ncbi:unnamed protein product, partial [Closterium sp. NIES-54]
VAGAGGGVPAGESAGGVSAPTLALLHCARPLCSLAAGASNSSHTGAGGGVPAGESAGGLSAPTLACPFLISFPAFLPPTSHRQTAGAGGGVPAGESAGSLSAPPLALLYRARPLCPSAAPFPFSLSPLSPPLPSLSTSHRQAAGAGGGVPPGESAGGVSAPTLALLHCARPLCSLAAGASNSSHTGHYPC